MSVLEARALSVVRAYGITNDVLSPDEIASEMVAAVLPFNDEDWSVGTPLWYQVRADLDVCTNCLCTDCACCVGCGQPDADIVGVHGYPGCV